MWGGFKSRQELGILIFTTASRQVLRLAHLLSNGYQALFLWG
jgi:hypothetical protein